MATAQAKSHKSYKRAESRNKHSWWWDSHISPKNSKWLADNLEEMDQSVKRMLKLIEEEGDTFAKKAEMYYQKRPELVSHVEEFYRMYRSLAERYDNVTGELRRNLPSDLQSQGSGISDMGSEPSSTITSPEHRLGRRRSGVRAAGFDIFLKNGGNSADLGNKEGDETSTLDSDSESDDSSVNNYSCVSGNGDDRELRKKITELEAELRKLHIQQEENFGGSQKGEVKNYSSEGLLLDRIAEYEEELRVAKEEIGKLRIELRKYESNGLKSDHLADDSHEDVEIYGEVSDEEPRIHTIEKELKATREKLLHSEEEVKRLRRELQSNNLQEKLESAQKDVSTWKSKVDREKREVLKMQDRISRYKASLAERDQEIRGLRETVSNANKCLSEENSQLQDQITKLLKERAFLDDNIKEWDLRCQCLEEDLRRVRIGKVEIEGELERLNLEISGKDEYIEELKVEIDGLVNQVKELNEEVNFKDDKIDQMNQHLCELHLEQVELVAGFERSSKAIEELRSRSKEMEKEIEKLQEAIEEGAEEKREAIRQLCFSLEHYRNGYHMLRRAFIGQNKRHTVMAS